MIRGFQLAKVQRKWFRQ